MTAATNPLIYIITGSLKKSFRPGHARILRSKKQGYGPAHFGSVRYFGYLFIKRGEKKFSCVYSFVSTEAYNSNFRPHSLGFRSYFGCKSRQVTANQAGPDDLTVPDWFASILQWNC